VTDTVESNDLIEAEVQDQFQMPEKFKDVSPEDIAKSYVELERQRSREAQELGELRRKWDTLVEQELQAHRTDRNKPAPVQEQEVKFDEIVSNPQEAVKRVVKGDIDKVTEQVQEIRKELRKEKFEAKHNDYLNVVQEPDFVDWISKSQYRLKMLQHAHANYDYDVADELLTEYKEVKATRAKPAATNEVGKQQLQKTTLESGTSKQVSNKKTYSRAELRDIRVRKPDQWKANYDEYLAAYKEGRVK
jgi:hypothetical protein